MRRQVDWPALRAAAWSLRALRQTRRRLRRDGIAGVVLDAPPRLPADAVRGVRAVLWHRHASCLERALILQRWKAAHGEAVEVVIGIQGGATGLRAHAWLDGAPDGLAPGFEELMRLPSGGRRCRPA